MLKKIFLTSLICLSTNTYCPEEPSIREELAQFIKDSSCEEIAGCVFVGLFITYMLASAIAEPFGYDF